MTRGHASKALSLAFLFFLAESGYASTASDCAQPVAAPRWEVGDTWKVQNELGEELIERVVAVEGGLFWVWTTHPDGRRMVKGFDADLVLRKVVRDGGRVTLDRPGETEWVLIGTKVLDFPLHVGKSWSFRYDWNQMTFWRTYRVVACEEITVVAGRFWTLKLEVASQQIRGRQMGGLWQGLHHEWYAPAAKRVIREVFQRPNFGEHVRDWEVLRVGFSPMKTGPAKPLPPEQCGFPVRTPTLEIGESWTYQDESGVERTDTVVAMEGNLTRIESVGLDTKTVVFYDADLAMLLRTFRVVACEEVTVVAGRFPAVKVEATSRRPDGWWHGIFHAWYAPSVKRIVRVVYQRPNFRESQYDREVLRHRVR
jgi:hypothetical protein